MKSDLDQTLHALRYDINQDFTTYQGEFTADLDVVFIKIHIGGQIRNLSKLLNLTIMCSAIISLLKSTIIATVWVQLFFHPRDQSKTNHKTVLANPVIIIVAR